MEATAPRVRSTSPVNRATEVVPTANATATFSEPMNMSTITGTTFKLLRLNTDGTTTRVTASVSYDIARQSATLDPANDLSSGATYKAVVTIGAQDLAGKFLDQNSSKEGNQSKSWRFTVSQSNCLILIYLP